MNNDTIVVLDGARTPIGSFGGMFKDVPAFELGATAATEALSRASVDPVDIREVVMTASGRSGRMPLTLAASPSTRVCPPVFRHTPSTVCAALVCRRCGPPRWRCAGTTSTSYSPVATSR
jgi:acetyl-CoA acetyltransferase